MGHPYFVSSYSISTVFNRPGSGRVWMDKVRCSGSDLRLHVCSFPDCGNRNCGHSNDVGEICCGFNQV